VNYSIKNNGNKPIVDKIIMVVYISELECTPLQFCPQWAYFYLVHNGIVYLGAYVDIQC